MFKRGFEVGTNVHPRDLVLRSADSDWMVEAKVVYRGNATSAVREAIGQLLTYRHLLYAGQAPPKLAAVFTEPIGHRYVQLLDELSIASIWKGATAWEGSPLALDGGLLETVADRPKASEWACQNLLRRGRGLAACAFRTSCWPLERHAPARPRRSQRVLARPARRPNATDPLASLAGMAPPSPDRSRVVI